MWLPHGEALQAERVREEGGREGGSRGKWIDGRTKRVHMYMHVLGEEKKVATSVPPSGTSTYTYM